MASPVVFRGAVLFAHDFVRLGAFYHDLLGWSLTEQGEDHLRLEFEDHELVVHQAFGIEETASGGERVESALKMVFVSRDDDVLSRIEKLGGSVLRDRAFVDRGVTHLDAIDLEGNIFQVVIQ
jgi:predicted enzyme related to lactoylglutathione lyase